MTAFRGSACVAFLAVMLSTSSPTVPCAVIAQDADLGEFQLKALFLYKFFAYIEWPAEKRSPDSKKFQIGVRAGHPIADELVKVVVGKNVGNLAVSVRAMREDEDFSLYHVVFLASSDANNLDAILEKTRGKPVLTIADTLGFAQRGVIVNMLRQGGKIRFEINFEESKRSRLTISSRLLKLARIVSTNR